MVYEKIQKLFFLVTFTNPLTLKEFKDQYESLCNRENELAVSYSLVDNYECNFECNLDQEYEKFKKEIAPSIPNQKETASYKDFCEKIDNVAQVAMIQIAPSQINVLDEDLQMEEENLLEKIDPITKQLIKNPVRNIFCNHVYEETSIMEAILNNVRCPYLGCSNKQKIKATHLKADDQMRVNIMEAQNQQQLEEDFAMYESDSD